MVSIDVLILIKITCMRVSCILIISLLTLYISKNFLKMIVKRRMGKKKFAYICNSFMYCVFPVLLCPCYLGMMGRGEIQKGVKETENDWLTNGVPHFFCSQCAVMQEARALKGFQDMVLAEDYHKGKRNSAAVAPMEMIRGDSNFLTGR